MAEPALKGETRESSPSERAPNRARYEDDFYSWLIQQADLLRARRFEELDLEHMAEELEDLSKSEFAKLQSTLRVLVMHMLKWDQQPEHRTPSWIFSIREQRRRYGRILSSNPGLKPRIDEALSDAYPDARDWAADETHLPPDEFPAECPYGWDDILDRPFDFDSVKK
ncbi:MULTISPECIES: DUF29 domain-containing protein [unclassified Methylobacterium]|jgi:hypothetical protein|uniref:DUF29 domain-containing protein n=1 Tax=unclassified Methylobacterium TaxID=2615210 RepID=UPI0006F20F06|nr:MULTISPECIES: DUF29 domain-containing protein [unclassified Methylobacterium]KQO49225.1 hypothetical protein ASF24_08655 [Methylobacterium sp. Leaf86]KQP00550.1 hypothetical protein ASF32_01300 [Methylobacterium sp. Leaf91]MBO1020870.1 DUF29 domain-containing protein [Methylobacterium sp. SD274]